MTSGLYGDGYDSSTYRVLGPGSEGMLDADFETIALHTGQDPEPITGAIIPPIFATSTYAQDAVANPRWGLVYSRPANPTRRTLEQCLAALEGAEYAVAYPSGMSASDGVFRTTLRPGDHILIPTDIYGGTFRLLDKVLKNWGITFTSVPIWDNEAVAAAVQPGVTRMIWCETPTNPILGIADMRSLADIAHGAGAKLVVDNTVASPYLQRPFNFGADIVVHSTTKYLAGHSDLLGGAVITNDTELLTALRLHQNSMGAVPSPFDAWLTVRGIKTLAIRMDRQCASAAAIAEFLVGDRRVDTVYYPGLPGHHNHDIAAKQMTAFGGLVSFTVNGGEEAALEVCRAARLFTLAESLGAVESLISHPARMTHIGASGSAVAPSPSIIRLSVGLESVRNLVADLDRALGVLN